MRGFVVNISVNSLDIQFQTFRASAQQGHLSVFSKWLGSVEFWCGRFETLKICGLNIFEIQFSFVSDTIILLFIMTNWPVTVLSPLSKHFILPDLRITFFFLSAFEPLKSNTPLMKQLFRLKCNLKRQCAKPSVV